MGKFVDFDEVRAQFSIVDVVTRLLNVQLKQEGGNKYRGICPFCSDPRSFRVTSDAGNHGQGMAGCFKCGPKGDSISLIAKKFSLKANDAAEYIREQMGGTSKVPIPAVEQVPVPVPDGKLEKVAARLLHEHEEVQALGISPETAQALGIGYDKSGVLKGRVLVPLYNEGILVGFMGYAPDLDPALKFPPNLSNAPEKLSPNVVKFPKAG